MDNLLFFFFCTSSNGPRSLLPLALPLHLIMSLYLFFSGWCLLPGVLKVTATFFFLPIFHYTSFLPASLSLPFYIPFLTCSFESIYYLTFTSLIVSLLPYLHLYLILWVYLYTYHLLPVDFKVSAALPSFHQ